MLNIKLDFRQRPYCDEYTRSHQNSAVKHHKARSVLGWGTAWEALRVPLTFSMHANGTIVVMWYKADPMRSILSLWETPEGPVSFGFAVGGVERHLG